MLNIVGAAEVNGDQHGCIRLPIAVQIAEAGAPACTSASVKSSSLRRSRMSVRAKVGSLRHSLARSCGLPLAMPGDPFFRGFARPRTDRQFFQLGLLFRRRLQGAGCGRALNLVAGPTAALEASNKLSRLEFAEADLGLRLPEHARGARRLMIKHFAWHSLIGLLVFDATLRMISSCSH
jgi:hypothetical protein